MKILFLFPHFLYPGGAANVVLKFAEALQTRGHKVEICCAKVTDEFKKRHPHLHFKELKIPLSNSVYYWLLLPLWQIKINRLLHNYKDYVLFSHVLPSNWWGWFFKRAYRHAKIVWYCHEPSAFIHSKRWINAIPGSFMRRGAKLLNPFLKKMDIGLEKANDMVVFNSSFTKELYEKVYGRKRGKVIYPPCLVKMLPPEKDKENYILTIGRLSKFKNVDKLIKAFKIVSMDWPSYHLIIVGEGEEKERLVQLAADLNMQSQILFEGKVSNERLAHLYRKARATVICSFEEPFGLVPVESMMYTTPVIAHNSGGPKETILHNETGFLYNSQTELEEYIKKIIEMGQCQYSRLQQKGTEEVIKYDIASSVLQLEKMFEQLNGIGDAS